jgi:hypothetical protein
MTKPSVHALLAELHKLLSTYRAVDFLDASNYAGTPRHLREALRALAQEAPRGVNGTQNEKARPERKKGGNGRRESPNLLALIRRSPYFKSTSSMIKFAEGIGLKLPVRAKESRDRVARRLISLIDELPDAKKDQVVDDLLGRKNNQTQGWIEVISRNP